MRRGYEAIDYYFGRRLNAALIEHGLTGQDLEDAGVVSASSVKDYIDGEVIPNLRTTCRIADFLGVDLNWLCGYGESEPSFYNPEGDRRAPWL